MPLTTIYDGGTRIVGDSTALEESLHPSVMDYVNAMRSTTGGNYAMTVNEIDAVNNMVKAMVANGIWSKMVAIYPIIGGTAAAHKYNLKDARDADAAFRLSFLGGGWTHNSNGISGNGTTSYADTFYNDSVTGTLNSSHISIYIRTNSDGLFCDIGITNIAQETNIFSKYNNLFYPRNQATNNGIANAISSLGFFISNRVSSTQVRAFQNFETKIITNTSVARPNGTTFIGALNRPGFGTAFYSARQYAFASIGTGLTDSEMEAFNSIVQTYQTKLGRQV